MLRRDLLKLSAALPLAGCASTGTSRAQVVVIGGGFGGATAANYIRRWDRSIRVVLVEREAAFTSCPMSNLVLGGYAKLPDLSRGYDALARHGVQVVRDDVVAIDAGKKSIRLARGGDLAYDRLVV